MLKNNKIFILLTPSGLKIYSHKTSLSTEINFDTSHFKHQEVADSEKYGLLLSQVFSELPANDIILLIADEFIYNKSISAILHPDHHQEKVTFLNMIPFDEKKIAHTDIAKVDTTEVIAVNKDIYEPILTVARQTKKKIKHIVPLFLIHKDQNLEPSFEELEKNYSRELFQRYDLISAKSGIPRAVTITSEEESDDENQPRIKLVGAFVFLFLALGVLVYTVFQNMNTGQAVVLNSAVTKAPVLAPPFTITPQPTITYKQLSELKIQIYNGSSISGQANKLKGELNKIGLTLVETGNYQTDDLADLLMTVSGGISPEDDKLLLAELEKVFPELTINKTATAAAEFDVTIIIGNKKLAGNLK